MEQFTFDTELLSWTSEMSTAQAGIIRIIGDVADALRMAALTGQWSDGTKKSRKSARIYSTIGATRWKNSLFPDPDTGGWIMPVNQATRCAENLTFGDIISVMIEL